MNWISTHFEMLFGGVGGTALVAVIGWWLNSLRKPKSHAQPKIEGSEIADSAIVTGSRNIQNVNSHNFNVTLPILPSGAPGRERYEEWRELIRELHGAFDQMGYAFIPINVLSPGNDLNDYVAGIRRGRLVISNRLLVADVLIGGKVLEKYEELARYAFARRGPREPTQRGCPTETGFNLRVKAFEDELMEIARKDIAQLSSTPAHLTPPKPENPVPNLVYVGGKRKSVFISPWAQVGFRDPSSEGERKNSVDAFVLKFENRKSESHRKIAPALNVIAKMNFRNKNGVTARDIDYAVWLNSPCNSTDMGIGDTRELVLMCDLENDLVTFEDRRIDNRHFGSGEFSYFDSPNILGYERVDVTLIDQNSQETLNLSLKFWREGSNFCTSEL